MRDSLRLFFFPAPATYDEWRSRRIWMRSVLAGVVIAAIFGVALYYLSQTHRF